MFRTSLRSALILTMVAIWLAGGAAVAGDSAWYVEAKAGDAGLDTTFGSRHLKSFDDDDAASGFEFGYRIHRLLAIQAGYHDLGNQRGFGSPCPDDVDSCIERLITIGLCVEGEVCDIEIFTRIVADLSAYSVSLVPQWPVSARFTVFGKLGVLDWRAELSGAGGGAPSGRFEKFSGQDLVTGVGVRYELPRGLGFLAEYQRADLDVDWTAFGLSWRF